MGAVFYNQAVDGYLDEKLSKPNSKPYKDGAYYTGLEHVWDEAWGYWGASANCLNLTAQQSYDIAKMKDISKQGKTILFVSHIMSSVKAICNRCYIGICFNFVLND